jgi:hypothetical protein
MSLTNGQRAVVRGGTLDNVSEGSTKGELLDGCYLSSEDFEWKVSIKDAHPFGFVAAQEGVERKDQG